jgi:hypothetical protein
MRRPPAFRTRAAASRRVPIGEVLVGDGHVVEPLRAPGAQRRLELDRPRDVPRRHHLLDVLDDEIGYERLHRREQQVADLRRDHGLHRRAHEHLLQDVGEVLEHDDDARAGILQLVLELARRVERIDVDDGEPGPQRPVEHHRILEQVGQHDGNAVALP